MNCPNCGLPFVVEKAEKFSCSTCGWMEKVGKEWKNCGAPESQPSQGSPDPPPEPDPAALEPDPAAHEPDPAALEPGPAAEEPSPEHVKKLLGGYLTITETNE